jgi:hypothetical protein
MSTVGPGESAPLGATVHSTGVNFSLFSKYASRIDLTGNTLNEATLVREPRYVAQPRSVIVLVVPRPGSSPGTAEGDPPHRDPLASL